MMLFKVEIITKTRLNFSSNRREIRRKIQTERKTNTQTEKNREPEKQADKNKADHGTYIRWYCVSRK